MAETLLKVHDLHRRFGGLKAVDGLSLDVGPREIVGLLGPNGSGKTTAINLISGVIPPDRGSVKIADQEVAGKPAHEVFQHGIARTFQLVRLFKTMTVRENIIAGMAFTSQREFGEHAVPRADQLLARVGLGGAGSRNAGDLTYMDQKKVELARALAGRPRLLLLDEWLAGLNPTELIDAMALVSSLRDEDVSILMVEHVLEAVRTLCDRCFVMTAGRPISHGSPAQVLSDPDVIRAYIGDDDA